MDGANGRTVDSRPADSTDERTPETGEVVVVHYSRTGTTAQVAADVTAALEAGAGTDSGEQVDPRTERIDPRRERSYWNWLARSFVPGSRVSIRPVDIDLRDVRAVFLGTPKWTLSCPPVTEFCRRVTFDETPVGVFLTYGGFDEERYARSLAATLRDRGADVRATLLVQRDEVGSGSYHDQVERFCERVLF
ncbi:MULTISPECIES: hypothetical protein [Haloferax]|uniref:Flavodoxin n=1 Tax=Haloferax marinum TaxID=2666143 RepID=A0A6A8G4Z5_9EURY|nr:MULTISPECIES: hypothetical protein [Haloferax]KAB1197138.1 hypothetical protein Hfx1150_06235 [Haloferax sp. CBA1150]MRW96171.1 hypothetical protein [Haloferax marinum]